MQQEIIEAYQQNFTSAQDLHKKLNKKYTLKQIKDVLKNIDTNQIIGKKQENKDLEISISAPIGSFQADLTFYDQFKRQNHGFHILLTVIEINTRYAYVYPLKDKKAESILKCLKDLYDKEKDNLKSISFDAGTEFENKLIKDFLENHNIKYIFFNKQTQPNATAMIERFNRTIREKISKYQNFHKQKNFIDELNKLVDTYNNTVHSQINLTPKKAKEIRFSDHEARQQKLDTIQQIDETFQIGDFVRVYRTKKLFEKGQKNYTKNIYKIIGKEDNNYILKKFKDGKLLDKELKKTASYLQKVNIFKLVSNKKVKKEVSKKEVKKEVDLTKKLKREGISLENIIKNEKVMEKEGFIQQSQPEQKKQFKDLIKIAEAEQKNLRDKNEKIKKEAEQENILVRRKSQEIKQELEKQLDQKDEEIEQKLEEIQNKDKQLEQKDYDFIKQKIKKLQSEKNLINELIRKYEKISLKKLSLKERKKYHDELIKDKVLFKEIEQYIYNQKYGNEFESDEDDTQQRKYFKREYRRFQNKSNEKQFHVKKDLFKQLYYFQNKVIEYYNLQKNIKNKQIYNFANDQINVKQQALQQYLKEGQEEKVKEIQQQLEYLSEIIDKELPKENKKQDNKLKQPEIKNDEEEEIEESIKPHQDLRNKVAKINTYEDIQKEADIFFIQKNIYTEDQIQKFLDEQKDNPDEEFKIITDRMDQILKIQNKEENKQPSEEITNDKDIDDNKPPTFNKMYNTFIKSYGNYKIQ